MDAILYNELKKIQNNLSRPHSTTIDIFKAISPSSNWTDAINIQGAGFISSAYACGWNVNMVSGHYLNIEVLVDGTLYFKNYFTTNTSFSSYSMINGYISPEDNFYHKQVDSTGQYFKSFVAGRAVDGNALSLTDYISNVFQMDYTLANGQAPSFTRDYTGDMLYYSSRLIILPHNIKFNQSFVFRYRLAGTLDRFTFRCKGGIY